jgi:uncharacterized protein YllA (UPF0747 family)
MPVVYPRFSATIIEKKIKKLLVKFNISEEELGLAVDEVIKTKIASKAKVDVAKLMVGLEKDIQAGLERVEKALMNTATVDTDMNVSNSFDRIRRNIKKEAGVLEKKIYSELKKQDEFTLKGIEKIYANIFPDGSLQERKINIISYQNKYGFGLIDELYSAVEPFSFLHKFLEIT